MAPACQPCGSVWGKIRIGTVSSACLSLWEKAVPQLSHWCQTLQFLPVFHRCLSRCYPSAGAQREWVWVSPCVGSLSGTAWVRAVSSTINLRWFLQPEVMGTYLPGIGTLCWGAWYGAGLLGPEISLLDFYPPRIDVGPAHSMSLPLFLSGWMCFF